MIPNALRKHSRNYWQHAHRHRLGAALGLDGFDGAYDTKKVSKAMAASEPAFAGRDWDSVGDSGLLLAGDAD